MLNREGRDCNPRTQNPGETRKRKTGSPKKMGRTPLTLKRLARCWQASVHLWLYDGPIQLYQRQLRPLVFHRSAT